jgi:hypothetical protein
MNEFEIGNKVRTHVGDTGTFIGGNKKYGVVDIDDTYGYQNQPKIIELTNLELAPELWDKINVYFDIEAKRVNTQKGILLGVVCLNTNGEYHFERMAGPKLKVDDVL